MSGLDGLNFDDILSKVAGPDVDIGKPKEALAKEDKGEIIIGKGKNETEPTEKRRAKSKKSGRLQKGSKSTTAKDRNSYSPTLVRKDLIKLLGVLHPNLSKQDTVNLVLQNYIAKNQDKIHKAMSNSLQDKY